MRLGKEVWECYDVQYRAPVFRVAHPKTKPKTATALAIVICLQAKISFVYLLVQIESNGPDASIIVTERLTRFVR